MPSDARRSIPSPAHHQASVPFWDIYYITPLVIPRPHRPASASQSQRPFGSTPPNRSRVLAVGRPRRGPQAAGARMRRWLWSLLTSDESALPEASVCTSHPRADWEVLRPPHTPKFRGVTDAAERLNHAARVSKIGSKTSGTRVASRNTYHPAVDAAPEVCARRTSAQPPGLRKPLSGSITRLRCPRSGPRLPELEGR